MKRSALPGCVNVNETPRHRAAERGSDDRNPLTDPSCLEWLDVRRARDVAMVRRPADAYAIHLHHIDPGFGPIRDEILTRWQQGAYAPALGADIAAVPGKDASTAQRIDQESYPGQTPVTSYVARTAFLHTLAHGEAAQGIAGRPCYACYGIASFAVAEGRRAGARCARCSCYGTARGCAGVAGGRRQHGPCLLCAPGPSSAPSGAGGLVLN